MTVTLVPWRPGDELRERNWSITRPYLEALGFPIITGDSEGPWSRGAACNAAAKEAGDWDVAIIADADTIPEPEAIARAIEIAGEKDIGVRPHDRLWRLTRIGTSILARKGPARIRRNHTSGTHPGGGLLVVARKAWDRVGGYSEAYVGWGHEDTALSIALLEMADWERIPGQAWHLWHPPDPKDTPEYRRNRELMHAHQRRASQVIQRKSRELGWDVGPAL